MSDRDAARTGAMSTIVLIHNARSTRNRKGIASLEAVAHGRANVTSLYFDATHDLDAIAARLVELAPDLIVVNGGDGTVQGILTRILGRFRLERLPRFAILPRGMANMTAADCGLKKGTPEALGELLERASNGRLDEAIVRRRVLKVENATNHDGPAFGMFAGFAGIMDAIRLTTGKVHKAGFKGEWSHLVTLVSLLFGLAIGRKPKDALEGELVRVSVDGKVRQSRELLWLATTLDRLVLRSRPFWNDGGRPLRFMSITYPPPRLIRHARAVLYGGGGRPSVEDGFFSTGAQRLEMTFEGSFTIDGEIFTTPSTRPLVLSAPDELEFVRL